MAETAKVPSQYDAIHEAFTFTDYAYATSANNPSKLATITNRLINSNDAHQAVLGLLFEFKYGVGPATRTFDNANNVFVQSMRNAPCITDEKQRFYDTRLKENIPLLKPVAAEGKCDICDAARRCEFGLSGVYEAGTDIIQQYVGSYSLEVWPNKNKKTLRFVIDNPTHLKSLLYHISELPDNYERTLNAITPLGGIKQIISWEEPITNQEYLKRLNDE